MESCGICAVFYHFAKHTEFTYVKEATCVSNYLFCYTLSVCSICIH